MTRPSLQELGDTVHQMTHKTAVCAAASKTAKLKYVGCMTTQEAAQEWCMILPLRICSAKCTDVGEELHCSMLSAAVATYEGCMQHPSTVGSAVAD